MSVFVKNDSIDPVMAGEGLQEGKGKCIQGFPILENDGRFLNVRFNLYFSV